MRWYKSARLVRIHTLGLLGIFVLFPVVFVIVNSFETLEIYEEVNILQWIHRYTSLDNYKRLLFHNLEYWAAYWNTLFLTLPTIILALGITSMAAYGLTVLQEKLQGKILMVYAVLSLLPAQVLLVPHLITMLNLHLEGTRWAVILVGAFSPWYVIFLHRLCRGISPEVFEMARVEGADEWTVFFRIALPQMKLGLLIFGVVISADLWGMVEEPLVYIQDPGKYPLSVLFHEMGVAIPYAGVVLFAMPVLVLFLGGIGEIMKGEAKDD